MSHPQNTDRKLLHSCVLPLRWGDMDAYGHVNNAMYMRYLEEARCQMLAAMDVQLEGSRLAPVIINVGCTFLRPLIYPDTVTIHCYGSEPGRSSFMSTYEIFSEAQGGQKVSEGYAKIVWMDHQTGKSVPLPDHVRGQLD
ncbi:acyl-CoA thioesterase [Marinobacterium arenosum]|uniref:acyl-CoA thioesterase n=1 Tax=Marinobacterium arenosum TaxID=2862496 RepID=UPI001C938F31|nr:acyl-CoA thioesterase [Marinobacterium arenosum]MBY4678049.1 acyl-CoA thioesterase [Marinobacterium arenosum]